LTALLECISEWHRIHKAFFEIAVAAQTKLRTLTPSRTRPAVALA
jgi:hypothetical protein